MIQTQIYNGFKLISLQLKDNSLFGDIKYEFIDKKDSQNKIYTSVIIGPNGTRKSRLFQKIILLFWSMSEITQLKSFKSSEQFILKYSMDGSIFEFSNWLENVSEKVDDLKIITKLKIDGMQVEDFTKLKIPDSIIANAIMITDRFPFPDPKKFNRYQYLGSRYRPQLAGTRTYIGRVVEFISKNIDSSFFIKGVQKISKEFLQDESQPCITYYTQNTPRFFKEGIDETQFYSYFEELEKKYTKTNSIPPFKLNHYRSIKSNISIKKQLFEYCQNLKRNKELRSFYKKSGKAITFNLLNENDVNKLRNNFVYLDHMRRLGIIYQAEVEFLKQVTNNSNTLEGYSIVDSSSGEHNLLGSMIGLIASIKPNSLIFIDEPEISLHPNWQMRYLSFLRELLSDNEFASCHIIVATHSHFLISDLGGENSSVIVLTRDLKNNKICANLLEGADTFGWSAEEVLYSVFNVRSSRNSFLEYDLTKLVSLVNRNSNNYDEIKRILRKIDSLILNENDPLLILKVKASEYIKSKNA